METLTLEEARPRLLSNDPQLTELHVVGIDDENARTLAEALAGNHMVQKLWVSGNTLDGPGIHALIGCLAANDSLALLHMPLNSGRDTNHVTRWLRNTQNKNIISFDPGTPETVEYCGKNEKAATEWIYTIKDHLEKKQPLSEEDREHIEERISAIAIILIDTHERYRADDLIQEENASHAAGSSQRARAIKRITASSAATGALNMTAQDTAAVYKEVQTIAAEAGIMLRDLPPPRTPSARVDESKGRPLSDPDKSQGQQ